MTILRSLILALVIAMPCWAGQPDPAPPGPTIESIQQDLAALPETETAAADLYREAISRLNNAAELAKKASESRRVAEAAAPELTTIRQELAEPPKPPKPDVPANPTLAQLEQGEAQAIAELNAAREQVSELQAETTRRQERRTQIPDALAQARQRLAEIEAALQTPPADGLLGKATRTVRLAEQLEKKTEIDALEAELASYDARRDLLPAKRDRRARRVTELEALVGAWRDQVTKGRAAQAQKTAADAEALRQRLEEAKQDPALQVYAAENERLANLRIQPDSIPTRISRDSKQAAQDRTTFTELRKQYLSVLQRLEASGLNRATGLLLRREFDSLQDSSSGKDAASLRRRLETTRRNLEEAEFTLFERQEARVGSDDIATVSQQLLSQISAEPSPELEEFATNLATARRDVLAELENDADRYQDVLIELEQATKRLAEATREYELYIKERILWVRSIDKSRSISTKDFANTIAWLSSPSAWIRAARATGDDLLNHFPTATLGFVVVAGLFAARSRAKKQLADNAERVARFRTDRFNLTVGSLVLEFVLAAALPALLIWIGWLLARPTDQAAVAIAVGGGLRAAGLLLFAILFVRRACLPTGLAVVHFRWPEPPLRRVRRNLRWFTPLAIPAIGMVAVIDHQADEGAAGSVGRVSFTIAMLALSVLLQRLARPRGPVIQAVLAQQTDGWLYRLRYLWYPIFVGTPLALALISWLGYYYTAVQLEHRIESSLALLLILVLANGLLLRWLFIARRRVAVENAKRKREQAVAEAEAKHLTETGPTESGIATVDAEKLDLPAISLQTRQLFRTAIWVSAVIGLFMIWADVLPALRILDRIEIYPEQRIVERDQDNAIKIFDAAADRRAPQANGSTEVPPTGESATTSTPIPLPGTSTDATASEPVSTITAADLGLAIIVLIATFIAVRNLPGLMEIVVLQRLPLDAGSRYALSTVLRYLIAIVGIVFAFGAINVSWSNIQWLAAALTFGLAFGLQEIFANFISGLIILAERPIRIGDTVTVGDVSGNVTRIKMRATTITDWDRKELIIPNKTFITGDVVNWTLSNPIARLKIPVGVSYGADVRKAEEILLKIANAQANVLADPAPYVVFGNFGDSTLDFELRVFIPHIDHRVTVVHSLHMQITEEFRKANIEIAFPQRDLHLRSIGDLKEIVRGRDQAFEAPESS